MFEFNRSSYSDDSVSSAGIPLQPLSAEDGTQHNRQNQSRQWPTGWRGGITIAAGLALLILIGNLAIFIVYSVQIHRSSSNSSIAPIHTGKCPDIKRLNVGIHIAINIVSTLLLGASNYCMQTISAPTRHDVDIAHACGRWLHIGVPSFRNLRHIQKKRLFVWLCLAVTSVPLHFVYNSIFFMSTNNNMYRVLYADESFVQGAPYNETHFSAHPYYGPAAYDPKPVQEALMSSNNTYENLTNYECVKAYRKNLIEDRGTVVLIVEKPENCTVFDTPDERYSTEAACTDPSTTSLYNIEIYETGFMTTSSLRKNWAYWICSGAKSFTVTRFVGKTVSICSDSDSVPSRWVDWEVGQNRTKVKYCLSEQVPSQCQLQVATNLIAVVVAFNMVKLVIMVVMAVSSWVNLDPLVTLGDAAASFIQRPDPYTNGMCLLSANKILSLKRGERVLPQVYQPKAKATQLAFAVSARRWAIISILSLVAVSVILGLLGHSVLGLSEFGIYVEDFVKFGIGAISPYTLINEWDVPNSSEAAVISTVLLTNLPQILLSFLYFIFNGTITSMTAALEWSKSAHALKPLRVSFPAGGQRSTYFLQLPYQYSLALISSSTLVHWMASQSFFMVQIKQINTWEPKGNPNSNQGSEITTTAGFSPDALFLTAILVFIAFWATVVVGGVKLQRGMPVVGNCSVAIAAACHVPVGVSSQKPVKWGVVISPQSAADGVGHCSFSNEPVELPELGGRYS